jgi:hypothetical protein
MMSSVNCEMLEGWEQSPKGMAHRDVADLAFDQKDHVYLNCAGGVIWNEGENR